MMRNQSYCNKKIPNWNPLLLKFVNIQTRNDEEPTTQEQNISKWNLFFVEIHEQPNKK
jgi:hypothetical protein